MLFMTIFEVVPTLKLKQKQIMIEAINELMTL